MKSVLLPVLGSLLILVFLSGLYGFRRLQAKKTAHVPSGKTIYDFTLKDIDGKDVSLSAFKGKKMLLVNVASECGYTPQYKDLEALHQKHKDKLVIIGFPANNFMGQEPGSNEEIKTFCQKN